MATGCGTPLSSTPEIAGHKIVDSPAVLGGDDDRHLHDFGLRTEGLRLLSGDQAGPAQQTSSDAVCEFHLKKFRIRNIAFAGRSASRRMKYGYHAVPYGTYTRTR